MASGASGHGAAETAKLKANVEAQLARLLAQLSDLVRRTRGASVSGLSVGAQSQASTTPPAPHRRKSCAPSWRMTSTKKRGATRWSRLPCVCARLRARRSGGAARIDARSARNAAPPAPPAQEFDATLKRMLDGDMTLVSALGQVKLAAAAAVASAFKTPEVIRAFAAREPAALRGRLAALNEDARLGRMTAAAAKTAAIEIILALKKLGEVLTPDEAAALASASAAQRAGFEAADRAIAEASVMSMTRA